MSAKKEKTVSFHSWKKNTLSLQKNSNNNTFMRCPQMQYGILQGLCEKWLNTIILKQRKKEGEDKWNQKQHNK